MFSLTRNWFSFLRFFFTQDRHQLRHQIPHGAGERGDLTQEELKKLLDEMKLLPSEIKRVKFKEAKTANL
jgi:hypothetical protein